MDSDAIELLRKAAKSAEVDVVACPAVVYEALRTRDPVLRKRLAKAMTRGCWRRLMPEAFCEAKALRQAIAKYRPNWLDQAPDLQYWQALRADWESGGWWRRASRTPHREARYINELGGDSLGRARDEAQVLRRQAQQLGLTFHADISKPNFLIFTNAVPGWNGKPVESWKVESMLAWPSGLGNARSAFFEWVTPWIDFKQFRLPDWVEFWTGHVAAEDLPLEWIRGAVRHAQSMRKVTPGTPVDNQIATYLATPDYFVSSDRAFMDCIEAIRGSSPVPLSRCIVLRNQLVPLNRFLHWYAASSRATSVPVINSLGSDYSTPVGAA